MVRLPEFLLEDDRGGCCAFPGSKPALVCFVKDDCPTCNQVMPLIEAASRDLGVHVDFFVCGQTVEGNRALVEKHGLTVPILDDSSLKVSFAWNIDIVPTLFTFDAEDGDGRDESQPPRVAASNLHHQCIGFVRHEWQQALTDLATIAGRRERLPKFRDGNDIHLVVAGAEAGKFSGAFHGWVTGEMGSIPVSRKIEV